MRVVLRADVDNLGYKGDLVDVADGYARNFLVPRGLAIKATPGIVAQAEAMRRNRAAKLARDRGAAEELAQRLTSTTLEVRARAGEGGRLFGSVTSSDLADAALAQLGIELDRRRIELDEPLKVVGPSSTLELNGTLDMAREQIDAKLLVILPVTNNLPLAALIVGAPAVGGALFVADKLLGDRVARFASVQYLVKGPWQNPEISFDKPFEKPR